MAFSIIAAVARDGAIGMTRDGVPGLPWPTLRQDMAFFAWITRAKYPVQMATHFTMYPQTIDIAHSSHSDAFHVVGSNSVIMGRRTWESLGGKPLAHRTNIVLRAYSTYGQRGYEGSIGCCALETALYEASEEYGAPHTFIIGGASVYTEALRHPDCERLYLTEVDAAYPEADTHWPCDMTLWNWQLGACCDRGDLPWLERTACSAWITEPERPRYRFSVWEKHVS